MATREPEPPFGVLTPDKAGTLCGEAAIGDFGLRICITPDDLPKDTAIAFATELLKHFDALLAKAREEAVLRLLPEYNDGWRPPDQPELSADAFKARLQPEEFEVTGGSLAGIWFSDTELFWGHKMFVQIMELDRSAISPADAFYSAEIFG